MAKNPNAFDKTKNNANNKVATPAQVIELVMQEAKRRGLDWFTPADAAAMTGSFMQETGSFIKDVIEFDWKGDDGTAHGLMQWRGKRFNNLINYSREKNLPAKDIKTQISFAFEEANPSSKYSDFGSVKAIRQMKSSKSLQDKATAFIHAERPAGYGQNQSNAAFSAHDRGKRINHAIKAARQFGAGDIDVSSVKSGYDLTDNIDIDSYSISKGSEAGDIRDPKDFLSAFKYGKFDFGLNDRNQTENSMNTDLALDENTFDKSLSNKFGIRIPKLKFGDDFYGDAADSGSSENDLFQGFGSFSNRFNI